LIGDGCELAEGLRHHPCLPANVLVAHFAFEFRARRKRRYRVHDNDGNHSRAH
jgi:hypothetical protein